MKFGRSLFLLTLGICLTFVISALPLPCAHGKWNIISIYKVKNSDNFQSAKFTVPENAEKIRLTFDITVDNPSGKYVLMGTLIDEKNEKWEFQETQGLTKTIEFNDVTGSINLSLLMMLAHADLTIEWFETLSHIKVYVQDSEGNPIKGAVISSTSQPSGQSTLSGTTGSDGSTTFSDVKIGAYTFQASKSGYETNSGSATTTTDETTTLTINIEEIELFGTLKITIEDVKNNPLSGVTVSSTSQPNGQSTLSRTTGSDGLVTFTDVKLGSYTFQAEKSEYVTKSGSVSAKAEETAELTITLEKEAKGGGGIPGFPYESIILGLVVGVILLWIFQRRQ